MGTREADEGVLRLLKMKGGREGKGEGGERERKGAGNGRKEELDKEVREERWGGEWEGKGMEEGGREEREGLEKMEVMEE